LELDPLYVANKKKLVVFVDPYDVNKVLEKMRCNEYSTKAQIIAQVMTDYQGKVFMKTRIGGTWTVDMLTGDQLPRIY
jgi:hydrogenase maturation factor